MYGTPTRSAAAASGLAVTGVAYQSRIEAAVHGWLVRVTGVADSHSIGTGLASSLVLFVVLIGRGRWPGRRRQFEPVRHAV